MSPLAFVLSTVLPAIIMGVLWALVAKKQYGRKLVPLVISLCFLIGQWQISGPPENSWPLSGATILIYLALAAGLLESTIQGGHKRWHVLLALLCSFFFIWLLQARLVESQIWEPSSIILLIVTFVVYLILTVPAVHALKKYDTLSVRLSYIVATTCLSIVALTSGSAMLAQLVGLLVALQVAMVAAQIVFHRRDVVQPSSLLTTYAITSFLILMIYFFVEVPRWPLVGVCISIILSAFINHNRTEKWPVVMARMITINITAFLATAWCVYQALQDTGY